MISISNLRKYYITGNVTTKALDNVSLTIEDGETVSIMGKSGSGKSTILNLVGGMDRVTQGEIIVKDKPITQLKEKELAIYRRRDIGFVFQFFHLLPVLTVRENIMLPLITDDKKVDQKHFEELITILGIEEKLDSYPNQLSGGQQQRVAIARRSEERRVGKEC